MTQSLLVAFTFVAVTAFAYPSDGTVPPTDDAMVITASCSNHDDEVFASPSAESTQSKDGLSADQVQSQLTALVAVACGACCPTYDPKYDCWAEGHWHISHCKEAEFCGIN